MPEIPDAVARQSAAMLNGQPYLFGGPRTLNADPRRHIDRVALAEVERLVAGHARATGSDDYDDAA